MTAWRWVAPSVAVAPQQTPDDMAAAAAAGFRSVVNNRPDHEHDREQPTAESVGAAAQALGLQYAFLPVAGGWQSPEQAAEMARVMRALPHPVLVFCRSGARSTNLLGLACQADAGLAEWLLAQPRAASAPPDADGRA